MLLSSYTVECEKYKKSGQGDPDTFPNYTNGNDSLSYTLVELKVYVRCEKSVSELHDLALDRVSMAC